MARSSIRAAGREGYLHTSTLSPTLPPQGGGSQVCPHPPCTPFTPGRNAIAARSRINLPVYTMQRRIGDLLARTAARIHRTDILQLLQRCCISGGTLALVHDSFIPMQTEGLQCVQYIDCRTRHATRYIKVFHAHQPCSMVMFRVKIACHRRHQRTEMQRAGGRWRKATAVNNGREHSAFREAGVQDLRTKAKNYDSYS